MIREIKVLHVLHAFSAGGLENGIVNLINGSPSHVSHELCLLSRGGEFLNRITRPVVYHELHKRAGNDVRVLLRLRDLFSRRDIDIIHTRNWAGIDGVLAACLTPRPTVIHGEHGRDIADPAGANRKRNLARRTLTMRAKRVVAVSKDLYKWLQTTVRIPENKLVWIPNGVDTDRFAPGRDTAYRRALGIADNEFVLGAIGRLDPIKNHEGLLNAVRVLNTTGRKVRLIIVGDGPNRAKLEGLLQALHIEPAPLLAGAAANVERFYRTFDAFVLNSFGEGMSNTLLEAMACGLPTICTRVGGNVELVEDGRNGVLIPPGDDTALIDAIADCMEAPEKFRRYGGNAREFAEERFSLQSMVDRYVSLYESVA